ncbi:hypothetical protein Taro_000989 [Colocasia esculenta]|uniref:IBH1-like N-terminal domain-containing protein n=1 Tax=Colocasia esculenta TaxID=4460 RepID=A0A843TCD7_COLES|nr:hypothetical protein [Colocasia esculenta]
MLALHFLRALVRINQTSDPSRCIVAQRSRRIKLAAYASIALAAGRRRAWSRAVLCSLHGRRACRVRALSRRRVSSGKKAKGVHPTEQREGGGQVGELRRLVPGGRSMELCTLLEEAGSYIQCLTAQVQLMNMIADSMSK